MTTRVTGWLFAAALVALAPVGAIPAYAMDTGGVGTPFLENQTDAADVLFRMRTFCGDVFVERSGSVTYTSTSVAGGVDPSTGTPGGWAIRETLRGAYTGKPRGKIPSAIHFSSFIGSDPALWRTRVHAWESVTLGRVYDGISLELCARGRNVEKVFHLEPYADPSVICVEVEGSEALHIRADGCLAVQTPCGPIVFTAPVAYQQTDGTRRDVEAAYSMDVNGCYGYRLGPYDRSRPLVIDPLLGSTYVGGNGRDEVGGITAGPSGRVYVSAMTPSTDFPVTPGAYRTAPNGWDMAVFLMDAGLRTMLAGTFIGGSSSIDVAGGVAYDTASDTVFMTGYTYSEDFPTTSNAYDRTKGVYADCVIARFDAGLSNLLASTYIGGNDDDNGLQIAMADDGRVVMMGSSWSSDYPTPTNAYARSLTGANSDLVISVFDSDLTNLVASTYLGGSDSEYGGGLALTSNGNICVVTESHSTNYPTTPAAFDTTRGDSGSDFAVSCLDASLTTLTASTYLGGDDYDTSPGIAVDTNGDMVVCGTTYSGASYPFTPGAYSTYGYGTVVTRLNAALTDVIASTSTGGGGLDSAVALAGDVFLAFGDFGALTMPAGVFDETPNGGTDIVIARLGPMLTNIVAMTYVGGSGDEDSVAGLLVDLDTNVTFLAETDSLNYPKSVGAFDINYNGGESDLVITRLDGMFTVGMAGEIAVFGNGHEIAAGDPSPVSDNGTYFGTNAVGVGTSHTFTITNSSAAAISLPGTPRVTVSGATNNFEVTLQPPAVVVGFSSETFEVTFTPTGPGARDATVSIINDDSDENPYTFVIRGDGPLLTVADALDYSNTVWVGAGDAAWFGQVTETHDGVDAARSGTIGNNASSRLEGTFTGPGALMFWWKVSSELEDDQLRFLLDGGQAAEIDGTRDWNSRAFFIPTGTHTAAWDYVKDGFGSEGDDAGWVDEVSFFQPSGLAEAVDTPGVTWTTGGDGGGWFGQGREHHDGVDAARSYGLGLTHTGWVETVVSGPGDVSFWWKVSSEDGWDYLSFYVDGSSEAAISGEQDWQMVTTTVGEGSHTLRWAYEPDEIFSVGSDAAWLDQVSLPGQSNDTDGDGLPDWWEVLHGLNASVSNASGDNADNDWMSDTQEYVADTDPTNALSFFPNVVVSNVSAGGDMLTMVIDPTSTGRLYRILATTNLESGLPGWTPYSSSVSGNGGRLTFMVTNNAPYRLYRTGVRLP